MDQIEALIPGEHLVVEHKKALRVLQRVNQSDPTYTSMIEHLDENVGEILNVLDERGLSDNTLVIFTSDSGGLSSAKGSPTRKPICTRKGLDVRWRYARAIVGPLTSVRTGWQQKICGCWGMGKTSHHRGPM